MMTCVDLIYVDIYSIYNIRLTDLVWMQHSLKFWRRHDGRIPMKNN